MKYHDRVDQARFRCEAGDRRRLATREHEPVHRYLPPAAFRAFEDEARAIGFPTVYSGVFVRSSFNAEEVYRAGGAR